MQIKRGAVVLAMLALFCAVSVFSQEKKLKKSDLPAAVQKTADEQSKGATVRGYGQETEGGKIAYEVQLIVNGHTKDVTIDPQGNVMEVEEQVDAKALPAEVREGLQKQAGKATIGKVESLTKHGTLVAYEAQVRQGKKRSEIQVGPDGKPLDHKE
jgi:biopolymer transport protein ExbD